MVLMVQRENITSVLIYTITLVVLVAIILFIQPRRLIDYLIDLGFWGLLVLSLLLLLLYIIDMSIRIYRWQILLNIQGVNLPLKSLILPVVSALAINLFTIARAGEAVRMYALKRNHDTKYSDSLSSIVIEQVLSIVGLIFVITGSMLFIGSSLLQNENLEIIQQFIIIVLLGSAVGLIVVCIMIFKPVLVEKLFQIFPLFIEKRLYSAYQAFQTGIKGLRSQPFHLILGIITSASIWIIEGIMIYVIAITVFPILTLIDFPWVIAASCAGNVTFIIPILPGAMGEYEVVLAFILTNSPNYPGQDAALIALIDRVAKSVMLGFFGGYATLKLGGREVIRLRKGVFPESKKANGSSHKKEIETVEESITVTEENNL